MIESNVFSGPLPGYIASLGLGIALGLFFLWGLWLTVRTLPASNRPALLMLASLLLRFGVVVAGFFLVARYGQWQHLMVAAAGFTLPRLLITRRGPATESRGGTGP
jgi:F1F0 ATPase subunit 2